ncbi:MAG: hypothetical protein V4665_00840 [Patescibacteria group bacterium]
MKKNTNFSKILTKSHENKWVALSSNRDKVLASSDSLVQLKKKVGTTNAVYMKVLPKDISFAF